MLFCNATVHIPPLPDPLNLITAPTLWSTCLSLFPLPLTTLTTLSFVLSSRKDTKSRSGNWVKSSKIHYIDILGKNANVTFPFFCAKFSKMLTSIMTYIRGKCKIYTMRIKLGGILLFKHLSKDSPPLPCADDIHWKPLLTCQETF